MTEKGLSSHAAAGQISALNTLPRLCDSISTRHRRNFFIQNRLHIRTISFSSQLIEILLLRGLVSLGSLLEQVRLFGHLLHALLFLPFALASKYLWILSWRSVDLEWDGHAYTCT